MELEGGRFFRTSLRSRTSSSVSDVNAREKVKDCCRKLIAFMCTQVGVGGLVVGYTIMGAFAFQQIEQQESGVHKHEIAKFRHVCLQQLWFTASRANTVNETYFRSNVDASLLEYQKHIANMVHNYGYRGKSAKDMWSFPAALMFSLSIITMIGYGNMAPKTDLGKGMTVVYALFGIPLYALYFMNMGEVLAGCFRWVYTSLYKCASKNRNEERRVIVPSSACLWVIGLYILTGALMFSHWEKWNFLDSVYFCVTSLCKIGFGDFVPGANISDSKGGSQTKLVINFVYMLAGLGLVAMCYNLMREEVKVKIEELNEDVNQCLEDTRLRFINCCGRCGVRNY